MSPQLPGLTGGYADTFNQMQGTQPQPMVQANAPMQTAQAAPVPAKGNFLTHLLPTAGGILGGLGGEAVDVFGGGVAGAAGGAALGKTLENKLEGNSLGSGVLSNAAEGGVGQGAGGLLGKLGGKIIGAAGGKATNVAGDLLQGQLAKGTLGGIDSKALTSLGLTDARQLEPAAATITGENGALNQGVIKSLIAGGSPVDVGGIVAPTGKLAGTAGLGGGLTNDLIDQESTIGDSAGKKILNTVNKSVQNMMGGSKGSIGSQAADPLDVLAESRTLRDLASNAQDVGTRTQNAEQLGVSKVYNTVGRELEDRLFNPGGNAVPLTDDVKSQIIDQLSPLKEISPKAYSNVVSQVTSARTAQELRPIQALWVRASQASSKSAAMADKGEGATAGGLTRGVAASGFHPVAGLLAAATASPTADRAGAGLLSQLGPAASSLGSSDIPKLAGGGLGVLGATSNNMIQPDNAGEPGMTPTANTTPAAQPAAGTSPASQDLMNYLALFQPSALSSLVSAEQPQQQAATQALAAEQSLNSLGSPPSAGLLSGIEGKLGIGGAGEYQRQAQSAAEQVAKALPGTDEDAIQKQLTDYLAGGGNIAGAIQSLLSRLGQVAEANQQTGIGGALGLNQSSAQQQPGMSLSSL